jgi:aminomethyltransferase
VNPNKSAFRGKQAVIASEGKQRFLAAGISIDHDDALGGGELLRLAGEEVGVINSPCWSHRLKKSLALVHLQPAATQPGTRLEVSGDDFSGTATVETTPFIDPGKSRTHV